MGEELEEGWEGIEGLPETDSAIMFASSGANFIIPDTSLHPITKSIAIFVIFIAATGFLNGLDYASPESGIVQPDEFVYQLTKSAPPNSAMFDGFIYDDLGEPIEEALVHLEWQETSGFWNSSEMYTDANGSFSFEEIKPGLARINIVVERDNYSDLLQEWILLSPPAFIEPYGFTQLDFYVPSQEEYAEQPCSFGKDTCSIREIDRTEEQIENPRMDPRAAGIYIMIGFAFMGVSIISVGFVIWALRTGSVAILRMSTMFAFFGMGHYYAACILGLTAFLLTFAIPKRKKVMQDGSFEANLQSSL